MRVCTLPLDSDLAGVDAMVSHDGLTLDLSQEGVVRDERFQEAVTLLRRMAGAAIETIAKQASEGLTRHSKTLQDAGGQGFVGWRQALTAPVSPYPRPKWLGRGTLTELARGVLTSSWNVGDYSTTERLLARRVAWLRAACRKLTDPASDRARPGAAALWDTPLFLTHDARLVSLAQIESVRAKTGHLEVRPRVLDGSASEVFWSHSRPCQTFAELAHLLQGEEGDILDDETYA